MAPLDATIVAAIQAAPREETNAQVGARLGVSETSVKRYRAASRREDEETAKRVRAEHTRAHVGSALEDLTDARRMAREDYEQDRTHTRLRAWLETIRVELAEVAPDPAGMTDEEIRAALVEAATWAGVAKE